MANIRSDHFAEKFINQVCETHGKLTDSVQNRLRTKFPGSVINRIFDQETGDEYLTVGRVGYHVEKRVDGDGKVVMSAVPGHFRSTATGFIWRDDPRDAVFAPGDREGHA